MIRGAERHFARILNETTLLSPHIEGRVLEFGDRDLFRFPVAYIIEVGFWQPTGAEVEGLRNYLLKGGFLIVDDFRGPEELRRFESNFRRVLPKARLLPIDPSHEVFDSFFHIRDPYALAPPTYPQYRPEYLGIFEDNDPGGRLMAVVNHNNDLSEYWEFADVGRYPIALSNDAFKFGVNYVIYAMTH